MIEEKYEQWERALEKFNEYKNRLDSKWNAGYSISNKEKHKLMELEEASNKLFKECKSSVDTLVKRLKIKRKI